MIRVLVKNEGEEDWRGCMVSIECDDYSDAATAEPVYAAKDLTLQGGSEVATVSGEEVVKCPKLTAGWVTVLSSEIDGVGHMTHVGPRRMLFRLKEPLFGGDSQWKLEWRQLGAANWIQTTEGSTPIIASIPVANGDQVIDLGECRPEVAVTGDQRWEWRLQAKSVEATTLQPLIRDVYPMSLEQWARVADTTDTPVDGAPTAIPGTVEDATGIGTISWSSPENATIGNGEIEHVTLASCKLTSEAVGHYIKATNLGLGSLIPEGSDILGVAMSYMGRVTGGVFSGAVADNRVRLVVGGAVKASGDQAGATPWQAIGMRSYGGLGNLWGQTLTRADIVASDFGVAISLKNLTTTTVTANMWGLIMGVFYADATAENRTCFAGRGLEFADSGVRRQHVEDEIWGELVPEGFLLSAPVAGQEGKDARVTIVPTVGDFDTRADSAAVDLSAKVMIRPAFLFCREAAE